MNKRSKKYHIVFGRMAKATLVESKQYDFDEVELVCLEDYLSFAPLCDLYSVVDTEMRKIWISETVESSSVYNRILDAVDKDIETIKKLISNFAKIEEVYLWTGFDVSEIVGTARLLYYLPSLDKKIFITDYPNIPLKNIHGNTIYPPTLYTTASEQIEEVEKHFRLLSKDELKLRCESWASVLSENSIIRVLHENGTVSSENETYFDSYLLSNCRTEFQSAARVIGKTLCDIEFGVGDSYLNWRLKQLIAMKKLEVRGKLEEIRHYEVRLLNNSQLFNTSYPASY